MLSRLPGHATFGGNLLQQKDADKAWQRAEIRVVEGRVGDPRRGRQTFERYVREEWLPNHVMQLRTRESYTLYLDRLIIPHFGGMKMVEILPSHVREWISLLQLGMVAEPGPRKKGQRRVAGTTPHAIRYCVVILSAIFTTALNDQVTFLHPCRGVKSPPVPKKLRQIITPEQFDILFAALPDDDTRLLVETDIETGLRWGELTELRVSDIALPARVLTVSRVVIELTRRFQPDGERFVIKEYPKDEEHRQPRLSRHVADKIEAHIQTHGLQPEDLLFAIRDPRSLVKPRVRAVPDPEALGLTEPNEKGRRYRHGTTSAYGAGKCRCQHCRDACAIYRAQRRANGMDNPRQPRTITTDGHIPRSWFRNAVWAPARTAAKMSPNLGVYDLRHAHASWLLAGGADLQVVKERLGHGSIITTQKYLHSLPEADDAAVDAFAKIRRRSS